MLATYNTRRIIKRYVNEHTKAINRQNTYKQTNSHSENKKEKQRGTLEEHSTCQIAQ